MDVFSLVDALTWIVSNLRHFVNTVGGYQSVILLGGAFAAAFLLVYGISYQMSKYFDR